MAKREAASMPPPKNFHPSRNRGMLKAMTSPPTGRAGTRAWSIWAMPVTPPKATEPLAKKAL